MTPEEASPPPLSFINPATGLFYNRTGAPSPAKLAELARDLSTRRLHQLLHPGGRPAAAPIPRPPLPAAFNEDYVRHLHAYLFQDVYQWAGETRAERGFQTQKAAPGREHYYLSYAHYRRISPDLAAVAGQLDQENNLRGLGQEQFVKRAAYYLDHFNHVHPFPEGSGRTLQGLFFELGRQAGYQVNLTPEYWKLTPACDEALLGYWPKPEQNLYRLEALLRQHVVPLPGPAAALARHPAQARPLAGPTPEVARVEALRELKASSQAVSIRLNEVRRTSRGNPLHDALFRNLQRHVMARPESIGELSSALYRQAEEAAPASAATGHGPAQLARFRQAIAHTVRLFEGLGPRQGLLPPAGPLPLPKHENPPDSPAPPLGIPTPPSAPKRRGPAL